MLRATGPKVKLVVGFPVGTPQRWPLSLGPLEEAQQQNKGNPAEWGCKPTVPIVGDTARRLQPVTASDGNA